MWDFLLEWLAGYNLPVFNLPSIGFTEVLDIAIMAFLIYRLLQWIRQKRAWSLFKGILFVFLFAAIAYLFNLVTVLWFLQNAFAMGVIVIVILFQPELRKGLEHIGKGIDLTTFSKTEDEKNSLLAEQTINEIIRALKVMSEVRTGALICLERSVALGDHDQSGIQLNAIVSSELLLNIFENKTPLHDGAVIIRHNLIAAAKCILPLTAEEIGHNLGTRHRAAVGISEVSDALVLVVSEETGTISAAQGGTLQRGLTEHQLRNRLSGGKKSSKRRQWRVNRAKNPD